ncbi:hypothetical protein ONE63_007026 [Megalurothrips usitatus]|uniref:Uncharacterized protein n=1 Tax=Megalurothrips usitatus TaxID=439358 RepID=A0AAV7XQR2_9NEOP|nr:hypothetical protein ONE63_007026 [Megalurothrips usitatus]
MSRRRPHRLRRLERRRARMPSSDPLGLREPIKGEGEVAVNEWARWPPPTVDIEDQEPAGAPERTPDPADPRTRAAEPVRVRHISVNGVVLEVRARSARPRDFPLRIPLDRVSGPIPQLRVSIPRDRLQGLHFPPEDRIHFLDESRAAVDDGEGVDDEHAYPLGPQSDLAWILDGPQCMSKVGASPRVVALSVRKTEIA